MTKKELFIEFIEGKIDFKDVEDESIVNYWEAFKGQKDKAKPAITDNGKLILNYMKDHADKIMKAKDIADGLLISARSAAPSLKKLATDGYVEVVGEKPASYCLTEKGKNFKDEGEND